MKKTLPIILAIIFAGAVIWMATNSKTEVVEGAIPLTLYKSPYCGCCGGWGQYMSAHGYDVESVNMEDMSTVKSDYDIPSELESCHTSVVEGYVVEGHIPNEAIEKLLAERPDIKGIGMAGMPSGSPGMPGIKEDFMIYEINHDGTKGELFMKL